VPRGRQGPLRTAAVSGSGAPPGAVSGGPRRFRRRIRAPRRSRCRAARGIPVPRGPRGSAADTEPPDQVAVAFLVTCLDVVEKLAALRDHLEQAAAGMVVLAVGLEMLGQRVDAAGEDR